MVKDDGETEAAASAYTGQVTPGALIFKLVLAGEGGVGKTSILLRYLTGGLEEPEMTVGTDFAYREVKVEGEIVGLSIWDFGGEDRFRELIPIFCQGAHGALLVFDLERYSTFLHLADWVSLIRETAGNIPLLLVGSKMDKKKEKGGPREEDIEEFCQQHDIQGYIPVSAREGTNIDRLFMSAARLLLEASKEGRITPAQSLRLNSKLEAGTDRGKDEKEG